MRHPDTLPPLTRPEPTWGKTYPGLPAQARAVRADLRTVLGGCPAADTVLLLVSELAANALAHSDSGRPGGTFTVGLTRQPGRGVQAEVRDQGSAWPGDLPASARSPHGLFLLRALSAACGTHRHTAAAGSSGSTWPAAARTAPAPARARDADGATGPAGRSP